MDFSSTKEKIHLKKQIIKFAQQTLNANIIELDQQEEFNREGWKKCSEFGLLGLPIPKDNGLIFSINAHIWGCEMPILTFGTEEQKNKYLPNLCRGEFCGAL
jgi:alkylation response protein AidB-like acyl-CoA dehydrogenase